MAKTTEKIVYVSTKLKIKIEDGVDVTGVLENMDYVFVSNTKGALIDDTEIMEWQIHE